MKNAALWTLAALITIASAAYQRRTGPTYPVSGAAAVGGRTVSFTLPRSEETVRDCEIRLRVPEPGLTGRIEYRPLGSSEPPFGVPMTREGGDLTGRLPAQPPKGRLAYRVFLRDGETEASLTGEEAVVIRFKGAVPAAILIPHILIMFAGMLASTRAGLAALQRGGRTRAMALWAFGLLFAGGMILGPIVQKLAFGAYWTGFPLGRDLTDTKTLATIALWTAALIAGRKGRPARGWVLAASVLTMAAYLIPHSLLGS
jgi:hypothetical protein